MREPNAPAFILADDPTDLTAEARRDLIAEAFCTFGEEAARELAEHYRIPFDSCADEIARIARPVTWH